MVYYTKCIRECHNHGMISVIEFFDDNFDVVDLSYFWLF